MTGGSRLVELVRHNQVVEMAKLLESSQRVHVDQGDHEGRTALHMAVLVESLNVRGLPIIIITIIVRYFRCMTFKRGDDGGWGRSSGRRQHIAL